ncbi:hypothetical protein [Streptomyces sp. NPDC050255]|uniref:hypothetical protein n=1 Tax=Streptomyces sp. NPDC050255 TaxID=3365606 RepID=UPI0037A0B76A
MNEVQEALCWAGPAQVTAFVIGAGNEPLPPDAFALAGLTPDKVYPFKLGDQPEAIAPLGLLSYDLTFNDITLDLRTYTAEVLRKLCEAKRAVAWAGFEGSFHYDHLLTEHIASSVYGHCVSGHEPTTSWDMPTLRSAAWKTGVAQTRATLKDRLHCGKTSAESGNVRPLDRS